MNDRELLELAAKAVGEEVEWLPNEKAFFRKSCDWPQGKGWFNPLHDDGEAFRLMNALEMRFGYNAMSDACEATANSPTHRYGSSDKDPRRVIVLVAAAIGEAMP